MEGKVRYFTPHTGKERGPGTRAPVFYNPSMVQNRDMSVLFMQALIDNGHFSGSGTISILDGLTGSGIRAVRFARELDPGERTLEIEGVDLKEDSVNSALRLNELNGCGVRFHQGDLNLFYGNRRFHYIDIDPFGTPVPFIQNALLSLKRDGVLAVTATDTAALTGSVPRVAWRRYGVRAGRTHFMQEFGARVLLGYICRVAASFEISVEPLLFYSKDHFIRGYLRIKKGARKADESLKNLGYLEYRYPYILRKVPWWADLKLNEEDTDLMGPLWNGKLSDRGLVMLMADTINDERWSYLSTVKQIKKMLFSCKEEDPEPMGGFDVNETSSHLGISPPSMTSIRNSLTGNGHTFARSRFSHTVFKTDSSIEDVEEVLKEGGES